MLESLVHNEEIWALSNYSLENEEDEKTSRKKTGRLIVKMNQGDFLILKKAVLRDDLGSVKFLLESFYLTDKEIDKIKAFRPSAAIWKLVREARIEEY